MREGTVGVSAMGTDHSTGPGRGGRDAGDRGPSGDADGLRGHRRTLGIAFAITATVLVVQAVGSVLTGSLALLTDTAHMLADSVGLGVALVAATLMLRPTTAQRTWGFRRIEVMAALGQAVLLIVVGVVVAVEGVGRLNEPPEVPSTQLLVFGVIGLAANVAAIGLLASRRKANLNMRAAFLEVLNDALGSVAVIVAAVVIATTGFQRADAIAGLVIAALIVPRALILLRETTRVLMEFTPSGLDLDEVRRHLLALDHVRDVHDLHASTIGTGLPTLTAHVVLEEECFTDGHAPAMLQQVRDCVADHFEVAVHHVTVQVETEAIRKRELVALRHP